MSNASKIERKIITFTKHVIIILRLLLALHARDIHNVKLPHQWMINASKKRNKVYKIAKMKHRA